MGIKIGEKEYELGQLAPEEQSMVMQLQDVDQQRASLKREHEEFTAKASRRMEQLNILTNAYYSSLENSVLAREEAANGPEEAEEV